MSNLTKQVSETTNFNQQQGNHMNIQNILHSSLKGEGLMLGLIESKDVEGVFHIPFLTLSKDGKTLPYKEISMTKKHASPQEETLYSLTPSVVACLLKARNTDKMEDIIPDLHDIYATIAKEAFDFDSLSSQMLVKNVGKISFRKPDDIKLITDEEFSAMGIQDMFVVDSIEIF